MKKFAALITTLVALIPIALFASLFTVKVTVPNLVGLNYGEAIEYYGTNKMRGLLTFDEVDGLGNRNVWAESNWKICRQRTPAGAEVGIFHQVHVTVVKLGENCGGPAKTKTATTTTTTKTTTATTTNSKPFTVSRIDNSKISCDYGRCIGYLVSSYAECSITVQIAFYDSDGVRVDSGFRYLSDMKKGEQAKIKFTTLDDSAETAKIIDTRCDTY